MRRSAYITRTRRQNRLAIRAVRPFCFTCLLGLAYAPFLDRMTSFWTQCVGEVWATVLAPAPLVLLLLTSILGMLIDVRRVTRHNVRCPHCGGEIAGRPSIVIATGNCYRCGERVIDGP